MAWLRDELREAEAEEEVERVGRLLGEAPGERLEPHVLGGLLALNLRPHVRKNVSTESIPTSLRVRVPANAR